MKRLEKPPFVLFWPAAEDVRNLSNLMGEGAD